MDIAFVAAFGGLGYSTSGILKVYDALLNTTICVAMNFFKNEQGIFISRCTETANIIDTAMLLDSLPSFAIAAAAFGIVFCYYIIARPHRTPVVINPLVNFPPGLINPNNLPVPHAASAA